MGNIESGTQASIAAASTANGIPFVHFSADELKQELSQHPEADFKLFRESWNSLPVDDFTKGSVAYRYRRYSALRLDGENLTKEPHAAFYQSAQINPVHGGAQRLFSPVAENIVGSALLQSLVHTFLDRLPGSFYRGTAGIGIHQIRIIAHRGRVGLPTPEGIHEDGHHFVAQVLI
ncbi:MAG: 2OG-Fe dioxygenase family protein, partial [Mycobacteriales bacterium]